MPFSNYARAKAIDVFLRGQSFTGPATVYCALHTSDPTAAGLTATEVSASWYSRKAITFAAQVTPGASNNSAAVTFDGVTGSPVTVTHCSFWDAATLGNMIESFPLSASRTYAVTDVPSWLPATLNVTCA